MKLLPVKDEAIQIYNKKALGLMGLLILCGVMSGLVLSNIFIDEANSRIPLFDDEFFLPVPSGFEFRVEPLTLSEVLLPSLGVIIVCISVFFLIGLIAVYFKIFTKTKSKYVAGLLFFLVPLFIQSVFSVNTLRSLFVSPAIPFGHIRESIGFGFGGLGQILVIVSLFEIIGLSILLYLSTE